MIKSTSPPRTISPEPIQKPISHGLPLRIIRLKFPQRTISDPTPVTVDGKPESMFLSRLPIEVRLLIYEFVFCEHKTLLFIHATYAPLCEASRVAKVRRTDSALPSRDLSIESHEWTSYPFVNQHEMAILRTCRQVYLEGLATAVTSNIFYLSPVSFNHQDNRCLRSVRPEQLGLICHLEVRWVFRASGCEIDSNNYPETVMATWEQMWGVIAANSKLKSLRLRLVYVGDEDQMRVDAPWLNPLLQVRGIKSVEIDIRHFKTTGPIGCLLSGYLRDIMCAEKQPFRILTHG